MSDEHFQFSSFRENVLEHMITAECLQELWRQEVFNCEVLKADVDGAGFDIVMEANHVLRHIQLKASLLDGRTRQQKINLHLASKPSGCVVWMVVHPKTLDFDHFYWFGGAPGEPLPDISDAPVAKHSKANAEGFKAERPNLRILSRTRFERVESVKELVNKLFGQNPTYMDAS